MAVPLKLGVPVCEPVALRVPVPLELGVPVCESVLVREGVPVELDDAELHALCAGSSCATLQKLPEVPLT